MGRKTAAMYCPYPGFGEFAQDPLINYGYIYNKTGWLNTKYLSYVVTVFNNGGPTWIYRTTYNQYTGVPFSSRPDNAPPFPPSIPINATLISPTEVSYTTDTAVYRWQVLLPQEYLEVLEFWQPYFDELFPTADMPNPTTISARPGLFNQGNPSTDTDRLFDFTENENRFIRIHPWGYRGNLGYNNGEWDGTFEFSNYQLVAMRGSSLGGNPLPGGQPDAVVDEDSCVYRDGEVWRGNQLGLLLVKSCLSLPQGMNCDAEYLPDNYALKGVVRGDFNVFDGTVIRSDPQLRLAPGVYTFSNEITVHSGGILSTIESAPENNITFYALREMQSGVPYIDVNIFWRIPDYCPP